VSVTGRRLAGDKERAASARDVPFATETYGRSACWRGLFRWWRSGRVVVVEMVFGWCSWQMVSARGWLGNRGGEMWGHVI
jgi:hypothetical protein